MQSLGVVPDMDFVGLLLGAQMWDVSRARCLAAERFHADRGEGGLVQAHVEMHYNSVNSALVVA